MAASIHDKHWLKLFIRERQSIGCLHAHSLWRPCGRLPRPQTRHQILPACRQTAWQAGGHRSRARQASQAWAVICLMLPGQPPFRCRPCPHWPACTPYRETTHCPPRLLFARLLLQHAETFPSSVCSSPSSSSVMSGSSYSICERITSCGPSAGGLYHGSSSSTGLGMSASTWLCRSIALSLWARASAMETSHACLTAWAVADMLCLSGRSSARRASIPKQLPITLSGMIGGVAGSWSSRGRRVRTEFCRQVSFILGIARLAATYEAVSQGLN